MLLKAYSSSISASLTQAFTDFWDNILEKSPSIFIGLLFLALFTLLGFGLRSLVKKRLDKGTHDPLLISFIGRVVMATMIAFGSALFLNQLGLGTAASGILAGAGVSAIILGFAFKDIGENFIAGFFLAFSRGFSIGDVIEVAGIKGKVNSINLRTTHLRTFDGRDVFMPNALLVKNPLSNYTRDGLLRYDFVIGLDYATNISDAIKLIMKTLDAEKRIEHQDDLKPFALLEQFSTSRINLRISYWVNSYDFLGPIAFLQTDVMNNVILALTEAGFNLPQASMN
ncbi:MAG: mechanosensitive ion channel family protein [Lentimicrobium sp.]|jgi:small-conductance mechanosensitive channel|nr:mechanosensitive ion channel family protein [Lentimicrobium sp.]MDD2527064.1 mechanosensitive ion channel family protein [Lentimicrobiaceae bacterium]MDD4597617.1 mechanosensitive ion channel family protein [Lentimicrobiaceae bacterium]MDY0026274.1 mechanosensitive ion channel family protein [Lentimicrobium sp.]HAH56647.1 mechanosensitive ion channel protein MscS [Bacteroidales bacterium]